MGPSGVAAADGLHEANREIENMLVYLILFAVLEELFQSRAEFLMGIGEPGGERAMEIYVMGMAENLVYVEFVVWLDDVFLYGLFDIGASVYRVFVEINPIF